MEKIKFGTDGVRAQAGEWPIDEEGARRIALGLGAYLRRDKPRPQVLIGRDTRVSGSLLASVMSAGLVACGVDVVDLGVMTTAGVAHLTRAHGMDTGVVISASHNPWHQNGIKLISPEGLKLSEEVEGAIEEAINTVEESDVDYRGLGQVFHKPEWVEEYIEYLIEPFRMTSLAGLHLALDCSNGAASAIAPACFERLGARVIVQAAAPDGRNINVDCGSEYVRESCGELVAAMHDPSLALHAGIAFDGDADRVIFIDEKGELVDGDHILYIIATHLHARGELPGAAVVTTEMANTGLDEALAAQGIRTVRTKVGDKYVVREIIKNGYFLGGEQSGHIILFDPDHTTGDGIYTALYVCSYLAQETGVTLNQMASKLVKKPQVIASAHVAAKLDLDALETYLVARGEICGYFEDRATINIRYSGTEPVVRVMIEADASYSLEDVVHRAVYLCRAVQRDVGSAGAWIEVKDATSGSKLEIPDVAI